MTQSTLSELVELVKNECRITWSDDDTERRVRGIVEDADTKLRHMLGIKGAADVFTKPGGARTLFKKYCLYDWNEVLDQFEDNYKKEIIAERHVNEVRNHADSSKDV